MNQFSTLEMNNLITHLIQLGALAGRQALLAEELPHEKARIAELGKIIKERVDNLCSHWGLDEEYFNLLQPNYSEGS